MMGTSPADLSFHLSCQHEIVIGQAIGITCLNRSACSACPTWAEHARPNASGMQAGHRKAIKGHVLLLHAPSPHSTHCHALPALLRFVPCLWARLPPSSTTQSSCRCCTGMPFHKAQYTLSVHKQGGM